MKRIMGIDYGDARTGVALSDLLCTLVGSTTVVPSRNREKALADLVRIAKENEVGTIVVGLPRNMDGSEGPRAELCRAFAEKLGLRLEMTSDPERLLSCLRTGGAAVANVGEREGYTAVFTHSRHYIAVIGEEPDGRVAILDPSYKEGKYEEEGRKGKVELKNGVIALCTPEVLHEDTVKDREVVYYLFWRK